VLRSREDRGDRRLLDDSPAYITTIVGDLRDQPRSWVIR
jgi:hypothetical protein